MLPTANEKGRTADEAIGQSLPLQRLLGCLMKQRIEASTNFDEGKMVDPAEELSRLAKYTGDPWKPDNAYFERAEGHTEIAWRFIEPFINGVNVARSVDLAAGHGRHTERLLRLGADAVHILDIQPGNVEVCRKRYAENPKVLADVTNGFDFQPVPNGWATFIFCFDAMVHFDSDIVRSYLRDAMRVLTPGGSAFLHHSNYTLGTHEWFKSPHSRNFMSQELFRHYAVKEGLVVQKQHTISWGDCPNLDCLSLVQRPRG